MIDKPGMQYPWLLDNCPSGQEHATMGLPDGEGMTSHCFPCWHGLADRHGFWQRSWMQAILGGQSWSRRHSGSGSASMGEVQKAYPSPSSGGMHVHVSLWFLARHSAPWAHLFPLQSSLHFWEFTSHCSLSWQSESLLHPTGRQETYGFPWSPRGQVHLALWPMASHTAPWPQVAPMQGSTQCSDTQALSWGQSLFFWHSSKEIFEIDKMSTALQNMTNSHWKHWTCGLPAHSGGHWHTARW